MRPLRKLQRLIAIMFGMIIGGIITLLLIVVFALLT